MRPSSDTKPTPVNTPTVTPNSTNTTPSTTILPTGNIILPTGNTLTTNTLHVSSSSKDMRAPSPEPPRSRGGSAQFSERNRGATITLGERGAPKKTRDLVNMFESAKQSRTPPPPSSPPDSAEISPKSPPLTAVRSLDTIASPPALQVENPSLMHTKSFGAKSERSSYSSAESPEEFVEISDVVPRGKESETMRRKAEEKRRKNQEKYKKMLNKGTLGKKFQKANVPEDLVDYLMTEVVGEEGFVRTSACVVLTNLAYPIERSPGLRTRMLKNKSIIDLVLRLASEGMVTLHHEVHTKQIERGPIIGHGASAKVYKAKYEGRDVAMKVFDPEHLSFSEPDFRKEVALMCLLENDNLVPVYGAAIRFREGELWIISELMVKGALDALLKDMGSYMDLHMKVKLARDICRGMSWLHSMNLMHRDLKSLNLLINRDGTAKLIDFGTSRVVDENKYMTANVGTPAWIAPEVLNNEKYSYKADVYSFGIVLWELLTAQSPFSEMRSFEIPQAVINGIRPAIPDVPKEDEPTHAYIRIMQQCWNGNPSNRPTFDELVRIYEEMIKAMQSQPELNK
eukprot:TRINITY_DN5391_c0_g1_i1.p1 TRINITY_DN5391_c0_g1~~TRINITY_DN5391_c0_g1_i1.p1  ORF type:complete len:569 (-),score=197.91 TRINITY_DN5391_c0_g1_i1:16-1722(-)